MTRQHMWNATQPMHDWCPASSFCMRCGIPLELFVEQNGPLICPDNDAKTYLLARHRIEAMVAPILEGMGISKPGTRH